MKHALVLGWTLLLVASSAGCGGNDWVEGRGDRQRLNNANVWLSTATPPAATTVQTDSATGAGTSAGVPQPSGGPSVAHSFRNTYYDFPAESKKAKKDATVFDATCNPIAPVSQVFHDDVCVQGSGRLATGETISFARRDCECAAICPRSNQKICFEKLDPKEFPTGRGATGAPVTPLWTVAVDTHVIPLGTFLFIEEYKGLHRPDGSIHDGCFRAEDRGSKVVGRHVDIFTGDPAVTKSWNNAVPSNTGVRVLTNAEQCMGSAPKRTSATSPAVLDARLDGRSSDGAELAGR